MLFLCPAVAKEPEKPASKDEVAAVSEIPSLDVSFFTKLRMEYARRKDFSGSWEPREERDAVIATFKQKDYQKTFDLAGKWLAGCPVDAEMHVLRSSAARRLGDMKSYISHLHFAYGLMNSVTASGDGLTPATAYKVIAVSEEYALLRDMGAQVTGQSLVEGPCDKMICTMPDGKSATLYFNVAISMEATSKGLKGE